MTSAVAPSSPRILVIGTCAVDLIGFYPGSFKELEKFDGINVSLSLDQLRQSYGGCAMNIAAGLQKFGYPVSPFALIGEASTNSVHRHYSALGMDVSGLVPVSGFELSSHALILTDSNGNQFTSFYAGPATSTDREDMLAKYLSSNDRFELAILAADLAPNMLLAAQLCAEKNIPYITDPGQCITDFGDSETEQLVEMSDFLIVNQYELETIRSRVGRSKLSNLSLLVETRGAAGATLHRDGKSLHVPAVEPNEVVDPTGCGDAFRVGLLHGRTCGFNWQEAIQMANVVASLAMSSAQAQDYSIERLDETYSNHFGAQPTRPLPSPKNILAPR